MKIALTITVNQPAAVVFDHIADARNEAKWNTTLTDYKLTSQEPIGKGSTFSYNNRGNTFNSTLSQYDKPNALAFDAQGKPMDIHADVTFEALSPDATKVTAEYTFMPKGSMKILLPLFGPFLRKAFEKEFEHFKQFSESQK